MNCFDSATYVHPDVMRLAEEAFRGPGIKIGDVVEHPDGRRIKIVGGQRRGACGLSTGWDFQEVMQDGSLGPVEHGYGGKPGLQEKQKIA